MKGKMGELLPELKDIKLKYLPGRDDQGSRGLADELYTRMGFTNPTSILVRFRDSGYLKFSSKGLNGYLQVGYPCLILGISAIELE